MLIRSLPHTTARRPNSRSKTHLDRPVPREELIRLLLLNTVGHNDILTRGPIHRSSDLVLGRNLQRVDHSQELIDVPPRRSRVREDEADDLLGVDDEYRTDGEGESEGVDVGGVESVEHVVLGGDFAVLVADDGELQSTASRTRPSSVEVQVRSRDYLYTHRQAGPRDLIDILDPLVVTGDVVGTQTDELDSSLSIQRAT